MPRQEALFDAQESADNTTWGKALVQLRKKKMSEKEIDKQRQAYIASKRRKPVNALQSFSQKMKGQEGSQEPQ